MADFFEDKDYGEYFAALEKRLKVENEPSPAPEPPEPVEPPVPERKNPRGTKRLRIAVAAGIAAAVLIAVTVGIAAGKKPHTAGTKPEAEPVKASAEQPAEKTYSLAETTAGTVTPGEEIKSKRVIFIDLDSHTVVAERNADEKAFPASTAKIMTALAANALITDYDDTFTMTLDVTDPLFVADATVAGYLNGEAVRMTDLLYGTILPSGADAAMGLALKLCGSEAGLVKEMNRTAKRLGLQSTHFSNVTGLHDAQTYTTARELALILEAALDDELCKKIMSTYQYTVPVTPQHPEGLLLTSTLFSYMYGTEPKGAQIDGGKTGFTSEAGYCIATFGHSDSGRNYLCVTMGAQSRWPAVYDQINLYSAYAK